MFSIFSEDAIPLKIELFLRFLVSTKILENLSFQHLEWLSCVISASLGNSYKNCSPDQVKRGGITCRKRSLDQIGPSRLRGLARTFVGGCTEVLGVE